VTRCHVILVSRMFVAACNKIRGSIYGINGLSQLGLASANATNGTGFMIAPTFLVTAAHLCHIENDPTKPRHQIFEAIRSPDIGQPMEVATFVAEDTQRDVALLKLSATPRSNACVTLEVSQIPTGTACGSLGFPLASVSSSSTGRIFNAQERFQSASVSAFARLTHAGGRQLSHYETDAFMYRGSSGCPGFLDDARVFAMHVASVTDQSSTGSPNARVAIALWVPALDIRDFVRSKGVPV
jgi:S1-C subfamily serine protease